METPVLGGYDRTQYTTERRWATSPDGTKVPMSVLRLETIHHSMPPLHYFYADMEVMEPKWNLGSVVHVFR